MRWACNQFLHWRVPARRLRRLVPAPLELGTLDGDAWVSAVALRAQGTRLGDLPVGSQDYAQVNLRTYVRHNGRPGIWLLGTFASDDIACRGARFVGLPYWEAEVDVQPCAAAVGDALRVRWSPSVGATDQEADRFVTERYHLYSRVGGMMLRFDARHEPWQLAPATAEVEEGRILPRRLRRRAPDLAHTAADVDVGLARPWRVPA